MKKLLLWAGIVIILQIGGATPSIANEKDIEDEKLEVLYRQISFFEEGLETKPEDANYHFHLGTKYYELGQYYDKRANRVLFTSKNEVDRRTAHDLYQSSIEHLEKSLDMQPNNAGAHFNLSVSYFVKGEGENAIDHMRKSEKLFMELKDKRGIAKARKTLREWFDRYGYRPEDFPAQN